MNSRIFLDREEAAHLMAKQLALYKQHKNTIVLGLAHGGAIIASIIGKELQLPFNVLTPRKIGSPESPELAIGAVAQDGQRWLNSSLVDFFGLSPSSIELMSAKELKRAKDLADLYSKTKPLGPLKNKNIILVDDGIATGATLHVTIQSLRHQNVKDLIVAAPVAAKDVWKKIKPLANNAFCLHVLDDFLGVSAFYEHFEPVDDTTVIELLKNS